MPLTLDNHYGLAGCSCGIDFEVRCGSIYDDGREFGFYYIGLHGHATEDCRARLAISIRDVGGTYGVGFDVIASGGKVRYVAIDGSESTWRDEANLGVLLSREQALASPNWQRYLAVADQIVRDTPQVLVYFLWPFAQPEATEIYTTRQILAGEVPIIWVFHDADGEWSFLPGGPYEKADLRAVSFRHIVNLDRTIKELAGMPANWEATREEVGETWEVSESEE